MTFPAGNAQTQIWFTTLMDDVINLQSYCQLVVTGTTSGASISANLVLSVAQQCVTLINDVNTVSGNSTLVTALVTYFQQQLGAPTFNAATEFPTLKTLATNILNAFALDYPHNGSNQLLDRSFNFSTGLVWITATAAQMPNIMPAINAYLAEIVA
jgi:hypothetical protein